MRRAFCDPDVKVVLLGSSLANAFSAGADIDEFADSLRPGGGRERSAVEHHTYDEIEFGPKPVICLVNGYCLGGGLELAMASDIRLASHDAVIGMPEIGLNCFPGGGGTERLTQLVGRARAKELIWTGRRLSAAEAEGYGIVSEVVEPAELWEVGARLASDIATKSPRAVRGQDARRRGERALSAIAGALWRVAPLVEEMYSGEEVPQALEEFRSARDERHARSGATQSKAGADSATVTGCPSSTREREA